MAVVEKDITKGKKKRVQNDKLESVFKILLYIRRSRQDIEREKKYNEDTLANQRRLMTRALENYQIPYDMFEEVGSGDKISTRPVFQQVLRLLRRGDYNAIAVKEIPRLGRGLYQDVGEIYDLLLQKKILVITPFKVYDLDNPLDARQVRFEMFFAREEYETIKERLISGKVTSAWQGRCMTTPPYGYTVNELQELVVLEEQAKWVRVIYQWFLHGIPQDDGTTKEVGARGIAEELNRLCVPVPYPARSKTKKWSGQTVTRILENETYIGTYKYRTTKKVNGKYEPRPKEDWVLLEDNHEAIIDKENFRLVQLKRKNIHTLHTARDYSPNELAGLCICGHCGKKMAKFNHDFDRFLKRENKTVRYYNEFIRCYTKDCTTSLVKYRAVEETIIDALKHLSGFSAEEVISMYSGQIKKQITVYETMDTREIMEKKIKELEVKLEFIFDKYEKGIYSDEDFLRRRNAIQKELDEAKAGMLEEPKPKYDPTDLINSSETKKTVQGYLDSLKSLVTIYNEIAESREQKNKILRFLLESVTVTKHSKGRGQQFDIVITPRFFADGIPKPKQDDQTVDEGCHSTPRACYNESQRLDPGIIGFIKELLKKHKVS